MAKLDFTVRRKVHLNCGDFNNIESDIILYVRDVDPEDYSRKFEAAEAILEDSQALELKSMLGEVISAKGMGSVKYHELLEENEDNIKDDLKERTKTLMF